MTADRRLPVDDGSPFVDDVFDSHAPLDDVGKRWKILIVDDEEEVHNTTRLVLGDVQFEGAGLEFLSAYSGREALDLMRSHTDIAVILLDVVMESNEDGLLAVDAIRNDIGNKLVRIVLRTGQPGQAPEREVIEKFDINDYKHKAELTSQRLFTTLYSALRSYRDLIIIEKNKQGLRYIIEASADLFKQRSVKRLAQGVLTQLTALMGLQGSVYMKAEGFAAAHADDGHLELIAATGKFDCEGNEGQCVGVPVDVVEKIGRVARERLSDFGENSFLGYFPTQTGKPHVLYLEGTRLRDDEQLQDILNIFTNNVSVAFENLYLNEEIVVTQREVIQRLGEVVESRSKETAYHVVRVAEYLDLLARAIGMSSEDALMLKDASPLHDIGKIGIPDAILLKPGRLTPEEFEVMKTHTEIGRHILAGSKRELFRMGALIASTHHERWDGKGYPKGLKGEEIPIEGRLTCLADVFDALGTDRIYKDAWPLEAILAFLRENRGTMFDPNLVDVFFAQLDHIMAIRARYQD